LNDEARVLSILAETAPVETVYRIRWYTIERLPLPDEFPDVTLQDSRYVVLVGGNVAAWAQTDAESPDAAEVSIETLEEHRRRGFARQVTAAWAADTLALGKVAYYSHLADNAPSQAVAASLGLVHLSDEIEYV
jgi:predicted GNAT family acetyltransferase